MHIYQSAEKFIFNHAKNKNVMILEEKVHPFQAEQSPTVDNYLPNPLSVSLYKYACMGSTLDCSFPAVFTNCHQARNAGKATLRPDQGEGW